MKKSRFAIFSLCMFLTSMWVFCPTRAPAGENESQTILDVFHPYRQGTPHVEGITGGMHLGQANWQVAAPVLPPELLALLQAGEFTISVQETTDLPVNDSYIAATLRWNGHVQIGTDGHPTNYEAGLPFPLLDPHDPQAGLKAAWNNRLRDGGDTRQIWAAVTLRDSSGRDLRSLKFYYAQLYGMHRVKAELNIPTWEKERVLYKEYMESLAPADIVGGQRLTKRYCQDLLAEEDWAYNPRTRRVHKLVSNLQEAAMGLNFLHEDASGFSGHFHTYSWRYLGEKTILVPGTVKGCKVELGGRGQWYPTQPWELRRMVVVEAVPQTPHHPYGRRVLYFDKQTYAIFLSFIYNRQGQHQRTFFLSYGHPAYCPWNNGVDVRVPILIHESWIDHQAERATVYVSQKARYNQPLSPSLFTIGGMLFRGK